MLTGVGLLACCATADAAEYRRELLIPGSAMHGVHGLAFDADGNLYGASLTGYSIYRIDRDSGAVTTEVGVPLGNSDDLAFGPDGLMAWTAGAFGAVHARGADGEVRVLATGLPGVNSINFSPDGRLFVTRVFGGDALYEIDLNGKAEPRLIAKKLGGLNGFEATADGQIYGPLFFGKRVVRVDVETGEVTDVADGFTVPAAVNIDQNNNLYVVDYATGEVTRIGLDDGEREVIAELEPPADNLAIDARGWVYVSNPAFNRITEINPETGATREIVGGRLSSPGGLAIHQHEGRDALFIADFWGNRYADPETGTITMFPSPPGVTASAGIAMNDAYYALASIWPIGAVYIVERESNQRLKIVPVGAPYEMEFLADGSLLVTDYKNGSLLRLAAGKDRGKTIVADSLDGPVGLARAGADAVYLSEYDSGRILRVALLDGARSEIATGLDRPEGIAVDADGDLIIAETGRDRLLELNPETGGMRVIGEGIPMGLEAGALLTDRCRDRWGRPYIRQLGSGKFHLSLDASIKLGTFWFF